MKILYGHIILGKLLRASPGLGVWGSSAFVFKGLGVWGSGARARGVGAEGCGI